MKTIISTLFYLLLFGQLISQSYIDEKGNTHLWGNAEIEDIKSDDYEEWYTKNTKDYSPELSKLHKSKFENVSVKVFLGTWCGDTKFLLPKFIEEWESMNLNMDQVEFIGLHNKGDNYKQGPNGETSDLNIHRVPTFIFYKDKDEIGRIVERTVFSLHEDMLSIVDDTPYKERYQAQELLNEFLETYTGDSLLQKKNLNDIYRKISREVSSSGELNTYGYVLKAQQELEKAEFVFLLNRYMFPYEPNVRDSYGELLKETGKLDEAKAEFEEIIRLKGSDENAVKQLSEIYEMMAELNTEKGT